MSDAKGNFAAVAIGSNLGDRRANIDAAMALLRGLPGTNVAAVSSMLDNRAVGGPVDAPAFLNAAVTLMTDLMPQELLAQLLAIEKNLGRQRTVKWGPRVIDLDLLLYGDAVIDSAGLTVPHPLMHQRRFVLEPLAEIAPEAAHPVLDRTVGELLAGLSEK